MSPETALRAFSGALVTLQVIGYLWLVWCLASNNDAAHAQAIAVAAYSTAGLNGIVLVVDLLLEWTKGRTDLARVSMMLTVPAFIASAAAYLLLP